MSLRDYQIKAIDEIRAAYNAGARKVLLHMATGGGKTVIFCEILKALHAQSVPAFMVVKGRKLVDQASKRLFREKVTHGVTMANHWNYRPNEKIGVCSIDTIISRHFHPRGPVCENRCSQNHLEAEQLIIDEAHMATTDGYKKFLELYPESLVLSVTATPFGSSLAHLADAYVHPVTDEDLMRLGYLVRPRYLCPEIPDLSGVKVQKTGDYDQEELAQAIDKGDLIGDIVQHWLEHAEGRPTLGFAVNVAHSQHIVARFKEAGIAALHVDADTPDSERDEAYEKLRTKELKIVMNVGVASTGVDIPHVEVLIMARPTKSFNLYKQQAGRGTRPIYAPGFDLETQDGRLAAIAASTKPRFLILDHAGNVVRHGLINEEREPNLSKTKEEENKYKEEQEKVKPLNRCPTCLTPYRGPECPNRQIYNCKPLEPDLRVEIGGKLVDITDMAEDEIYILRLKATASKHGYSWMWCAHRLKERYGIEITLKHYPGFERAQKYNSRRILSQQASEFLREQNAAK